MLDMKKTKKWLILRLTVHVEGYVKCIQDQELNTKETQRRREKDMQKKRTMDTKCRVCHQKGELVYHPVCSCRALAPSLYLKVRHNQIPRIVYHEVIKSDHILLNALEATVKEPFEICYGMETQTASKVEKNKPGPIHHFFLCFIFRNRRAPSTCSCRYLILAYFNWSRFSTLISNVWLVVNVILKISGKDCINFSIQMQTTTI